MEEQDGSRQAKKTLKRNKRSNFVEFEDFVIESGGSVVEFGDQLSILEDNC